jgi:hypothetical protein
MFEASVSWDKKTIAYDKSIGRNDGIYPDTVLWGVAVNGCCNPTFETFIAELSKASRAAEQSVQPTASGVGMRARLGHWLVSLGQSLIQNGGG